MHLLEGPPPPSLAQALAEFEREFTYPLGPGRWFRIAHGDDYPRFFRAMGRAGCFVAQDEGGRVLGTLATAIRRLGLPDGREQPAAYIGDLKVTTQARGGRALFRLARAAQEWGSGEAQAFFSVVMDGTAATPERYTGRAGLPAFAALAKIVVLRLSVSAEAAGDPVPFAADTDAGERCYRELSRGRYWSPGGRPQERSEFTPAWLLDPAGAACGRLEDTRRAKRLFGNDGSELVSAHLSCFAFSEVAAGAALLRAAARRAAGLGYPALFLAVAEPDAEAMLPRLVDVRLTVAPATVYGAGLKAAIPWNINTAEI